MSQVPDYILKIRQESSKYNIPLFPENKCMHLDDLGNNAYIYNENGYYECPLCGDKYKPLTPEEEDELMGKIEECIVKIRDMYAKLIEEREQ